MITFKFLNVEATVQDGASSIIVALSIIGLYIYAMFWAFWDARRRGRNPWTCVFLLTMTGWPLSHLWWASLRPSLLREAEAREQAI